MARVRVLSTDARTPGRRETDAALSLANRMPRLVLEARRVAASLTHGLHGRRRAGPGESFWQFRLFVAGGTAPRGGLRRSGRGGDPLLRGGGGGGGPSVWVWVRPPASEGPGFRIG